MRGGGGWTNVCTVTKYFITSLTHCCDLFAGQHQRGRGSALPGREHLGQRQRSAVRGEQRRPDQTGPGDCGCWEQVGLLLTLDPLPLSVSLPSAGGTVPVPTLRLSGPRLQPLAGIWIFFFGPQSSGNFSSLRRCTSKFLTASPPYRPEQKPSFILTLPLPSFSHVSKPQGFWLLCLSRRIFSWLCIITPTMNSTQTSPLLPLPLQPMKDCTTTCEGVTNYAQHWETQKNNL